MKRELLDSKGIITKEALEKLKEVAPNVSCECPAYLIKIYELVKEFSDYQEECLNETPQDVLIHEWLKSSSQNIEHIVSNTIVTLARLEGMITSENEIIKRDDESFDKMK